MKTELGALKRLGSGVPGCLPQLVASGTLQKITRAEKFPAAGAAVTRAEDFVGADVIVTRHMGERVWRNLTAKGVDLLTASLIIAVGHLEVSLDVGLDVV